MRYILYIYVLLMKTMVHYTISYKSYLCHTAYENFYTYRNSLIVRATVKMLNTITITVAVSVASLLCSVANTSMVIYAQQLEMYL